MSRAKKLKVASRIQHSHAVRIVRREAALRVHSELCAVIVQDTGVFVASDTRLVTPGTDDHSFEIVYDCLCEECLAAQEK